MNIFLYYTTVYCKKMLIYLSFLLIIYYFCNDHGMHEYTLLYGAEKEDGR